MAENIYYPNLGEIYARAAQVKNAMYEQQMAPIRMQNELVSNRINQLKAREIENEFATKMGRQEAAKKYFQPAQPAQTVAPMQTGAVPSYTGNQFAQSTYGQNVETAQARPAGFDVAGYQASRYGAGDIEGARAVQSGITDKDIVSVIKDLGTDKFKALKPMLSKLNPNFALIDENSLSISRNGEIAFPVLSPDGKPTGKGVIYGKDGKKQIVDIGGKSDKQIEKTVDLGDKIEYIYADGTREMKPKGMAPGANIQDRRLQLMEEKETKKEEATAKKEDLKMKGAMAKADILIGKVDEALSKTGFWTTGLTGDLRSTMLGRTTGSGAFNLEKTIDTIKSIIGFEELQAMRDASKTGGALGQIAVRELELLQSTIAGLDKGQSEAQLRQNLEQVKTHYQNIKATLAKIAEAEAQTTVQPQTKAPTGKRPPLSAFEKR